MELLQEKKKFKVDLNRQWGLFFCIGLLVSLGLTLFFFEYKSYEDLQKITLEPLQDDFTETIEIPVTEMPPPPPPVLQQPEIVEVPDEQELKNDIEMNLDVDVNQEVTVTAPVIQNTPAPPPVEEEKDEVFLIVEDQPTPEGGMPAFYKYVADNLKYPKQASRMGVEGRVFVQFVVDKDGGLNDIKVLKGIGAGCDEEAMRVIKESPKWKPGKQRGRPVKVKMSLPIQFKLN
jgi:protein TonB